MASLSTCHLGLWRGWQILLNLVKLLDTNVDGVPDDYGDNRGTHDAILDIPAIP